MEWNELKWHKAGRDYSFSFVKCLVIAKNGNVVISAGSAVRIPTVAV